LSAPARAAKKALEGITGATSEIAAPAREVTGWLKGVKNTIAEIVEPARAASAAVNGIRDSTKQVVDPVKKAASATRVLTRGQFALGRAIVLSRRSLLANLPGFDAAGTHIGRGLRLVGTGLHDTVRRSVRVTRMATIAGFELGRGAATLAGLTAGGVLASLKYYAKSTAAQIKFGKQTGFSVQMLRELSAVAESQGIPLASFENSIEGVQKRLGELKRGKGALANLYRQINPRLYRQLRGERDPEKALEAILNDIARVKDPSKRQLLAQTAFGQGGGDMVRLAMMKPEERRAEREASRRRRGALSPEDLEQADALDNTFGHVTESIMGLRDAIGSALAPVLTPILAQFSEWLILNRQLIAGDLKNFVFDLKNRFDQIDFKGLVNDIRSMVRSIDAAVRSTIGWKATILTMLAIPFAPGLLAITSGLFRLAKGLKGLGGLFIKAFRPMILPSLAMVGRGILAVVLRIGAGILALVAGWPVMLAAAIGTGIVMAFRNWGSIKEWLAGLFAQLPAGLQDALTAAMNAFAGSSLGRLLTNVGGPILQWVSDLIDGMIAAVQGNVGQLQEVLLRPFKALWEFVSGLAGRIKEAISAALQFKLPSFNFPWSSGTLSPGSSGGNPGQAPAAPGLTDGLAPPQMLRDVVQQIDNRRETKNDVKVDNHIQVNVATDASPGSIGSAIAGAVSSATRRALGGLHDGGVAGSAYQGAP